MQYFKYKWIQYNCKQLLESLETNYIDTLNTANYLTGI